ncbi:ABC transporter, partial [Mycena alexandri]
IFQDFPFGGISLFGVTFLLKAVPPLGADPNKRSARDLFHQVLRLDYVGAILVAGAVTTLVLALQWGGDTKAWGDKDVIISFVFAAALTVAFIGWEKYLNERAMVPTAIFNRAPCAYCSICAYAFLNQFGLLIISYYIPIYYQAARAHSATRSGIDLLPFMLGTVITIMVVGSLVGRFGYYWPFLITATVFLAIGSGLLYTINTNTSSANLIGFQILVGIGIGMGLQNTILASQVEFKDTPMLIGQANSMVSFARLLGGKHAGSGVAESVFSSELTKYLLEYAPDALAAIVKDSPTAIYTAMPKEIIPGVVRSYTSALRVVFVLGAPVAGLALIAAIFINNIHIPKEVPKDASVNPEVERDVEDGSES